MMSTITTTTTTTTSVAAVPGRQQQQQNYHYYSAATIRANWYAIQSLTIDRWRVLLRLRRTLSAYPAKTSFKELRSIFEVIGDLGVGVYGKVFEIQLKRGDAAVAAAAQAVPYQFALKVVQVNNVRKVDRADIVAKLFREIQAFGFSNGLVYLRICPNFTLVPRIFFTKQQQQQQQKKNVSSSSSSINGGGDKRKVQQQSSICCMIVMEREAGTLREWIKSSSSDALPEMIMGAILQVFMGICAYVKHLELCHNDLYLKNILYTQCEPVDLKYTLLNRTYVIPACPIVVKISDFGIATSPKVLRTSHMNMSHLVHGHLKLDNFVNYDFSRHIIDYENVQPYARDPAVVLRSLTLYTSCLNSKVRIWAERALSVLDRYCAYQRMYHWQYVLEYTNEIFSPEFLSEGGGDFAPTIFSPPAAAAAFQQQQRAEETFHIDGDHIGPPERVMHYLTEQVQYFHKTSDIGGVLI